MNNELKITLCKHEIDKVIKIINSFDEDTVNFELGFETSVVISSISKGIEKYIKDNKLFDIYLGPVSNVMLGVSSYSECVKMHCELFGDNYIRTLLKAIQRFRDSDYGDMYDYNNKEAYERDKACKTLKGLYDTVYGKIYISMNDLGHIKASHYFERKLEISNNRFASQTRYLG